MILALQNHFSRNGRCLKNCQCITSCETSVWIYSTTAKEFTVHKHQLSLLRVTRLTSCEQSDKQCCCHRRLAFDWRHPAVHSCLESSDVSRLLWPAQSSVQWYTPYSSPAQTTHMHAHTQLYTVSLYCTYTHMQLSRFKMHEANLMTLCLHA